MPRVAIDISPELAARIAERSAQREHIEATAARALREWCDLGDARTEQGGALATLLDQIGATARGEMSAPTREELGDWLGMLRTALGLRHAPD
jgi:hypothetical protein